MTMTDVTQIAEALRQHPSIRSKLSISKATNALGLGQEDVGRPGDDAAILKRPDGGYDLLAGEGFIPAFVKNDPWFAGWCGVMVNLSDIAAMGGRAVGLVDQVWAPDPEAAESLMQGLHDAASAYAVPILGGHTNFSTAELNLAVSIFGRTEALITSFDAAAGDIIVAAIDMDGAYRNFDNFFAAGDKAPADLRSNLEILPRLAGKGWVRAGKDISQGGIAGTALMLAECSGIGIDLDLDQIAPPAGVTHERWMRSFPSFGFLLSVSPKHVKAVCDEFSANGICAEAIGRVFDGSSVRFHSSREMAAFWDYQMEPYLGLGKKELAHA